MTCNKRRTIVTRSSAEAEYRVMAHTAFEMVWVQSFLHEM